jgi:hypothetical protein
MDTQSIILVSSYVMQRETVKETELFANKIPVTKPKLNKTGLLDSFAFSWITHCTDIDILTFCSILSPFSFPFFILPSPFQCYTYTQGSCITFPSNFIVLASNLTFYKNCLTPTELSLLTQLLFFIRNTQAINFQFYSTEL